jgi:hypothetical protein
LGKKTSDKFIFGKSHFADEERIREPTSEMKRYFEKKLPWKTKRDFGEIICGERLRKYQG